ncbi:hypothetical protein [Helicobacter pylori]|uniref:hypothetical protein n=1 Tax=Helicobacter pylori TaxID=210 RepID=UPI000D3D3A72|nr:hypothetical protein [Helicobacter pylori]PUD03174.1 hypothetical protein C2R91_03515 [Helicobacter pylori]
MRHEHETATSFNQLKEITQAMHTLKTRTKTGKNTHTSKSTHKLAINPKDSVKAKKGALNPTKKAFSERQITAFRDNSQASANSRRKTKASHNANAFKTEQGNNSNLRAKPSDEAFKQGLKKQPKQPKRGKNEA